MKAPAKPVPAAPAPAAKKPVVAASKPTKSAPSAAAPVTDSFKFKHSAEEADSLASELIPGTILTDFADANWKTRLAALEEATTWLEGLSYDVDSEVLIRALGKKGWADKNFQVRLIYVFLHFSHFAGVFQTVWNYRATSREESVFWAI